MTMYFRLYGFAIIMMLSIASCIKTVDKFNYGDEGNTKLVIASIISPEQRQVRVIVNKTSPYFSNTLPRYIVKNALVSIRSRTQSGILTLNPSPNTGIYSKDFSFYYIDTSSLKIIPGETYFLEVHTPDGLSAKANCTVPSEMSVTEIYTKDTVLDRHQSFKVTNIEWQVGPENIMYFFNADIKTKITQNGNDSTVYNNRSYLGSMVLDQPGMRFNARFYWNYQTSYPNSVLRLTKINFKLYESNLYQFYYKGQSNITTENAYQNPPGNNFFLGEYLMRYAPDEFILPKKGLFPGNVVVNSGLNILVEGTDYEIDYSKAILKVLNISVLSISQRLRVSFKNSNYSLPVNASTFSNPDSTGIQFEDNLFSEPTRYFSNVEGGYGIFGAYNISVVETGYDF